jgi:hypothetical protein
MNLVIEHSRALHTLLCVVVEFLFSRCMLHNRSNNSDLGFVKSAVKGPDRQVWRFRSVRPTLCKLSSIFFSIVKKVH